MYKYIVDVRYKINEDNEDPCTFHIFLEKQDNAKVEYLWDQYARTEVLVQLKTIKEADEFGRRLHDLKKDLSAGCKIYCYIVTNKWEV